MRISKKPKTQDYLIFSNIAERDTAKDKLSNGQDVKVLDASADSNIKSGWAIYKYDQKTDVFDLVEKEEISNIPTPDGITVEPILDDKLHVASALENYAHLTILNDFQLKAAFNSNTKIIMIYPEPYPNPLQINAKMYYNGKTFGVKNVNIAIKNWANLLQGKTFYAAICTKLVTDGSNQMYYKLGLGKFPDLSSLDPEIDVLLAIVKIPIPEDINDTNPHDLVLHRLYRKALAPAEERIKGYEPDNDTIILDSNKKLKAVAEPIDNYTIKRFTNGNDKAKLADISSYLPYQPNLLFLKDFDFDFSVSDTRITLTPRAGNENIPVLIDGVKKYVSITAWSLNKSEFSAGIKEAHWVVYAYIKTDANAAFNGMSTGYYSSNGNPIELKHVSTLEIPIMQVRAILPNSGVNFDTKEIYVYKYWKKALAPAEERIILPSVPTNSYNIDETTLFEEVLNEKTTIIAPALAQPIPVNYRILQDFDFDFSYGKSSYGNTFFDISPIGGSKQVPILVNGLRKYLSIANEGVIMSDLFGANFGGSYKYFALSAKIDDAKGTISTFKTLYKNGSAWLNCADTTPNYITIAMIGVKFNSDNSTFDYKNVKIFKFWKNRLAPFDELYSELITP